MLPEGKKKQKVPVVMIIQGSGPTDKDGNSAGIPGKNNSLKMLAEALAEEGIASLRFDKRGMGLSQSAGKEEQNLSFDDFVADASQWFDYLAEQKRFTKVGIAGQYLSAFESLKNGIILPLTASFSNHTFHQFTLRVLSEKRDDFASFMYESGIATMIYYPIPLHKQKAYAHFEPRTSLSVSESLSNCVISIPVHEALEPHEVRAIRAAVTTYFS